MESKEELFFAQKHENLYAMIKRCLEERGMKPSDMYSKGDIETGIKRYTMSKVKTGKRIKKRTAVAFAMALKLSLCETTELLAKAGFGLDSSDRGDAVVIWQIENKDFSVKNLDSMLHKWAGIGFEEYGNY